MNIMLTMPMREAMGAILLRDTLERIIVNFLGIAVERSVRLKVQVECCRLCEDLMWLMDAGNLNVSVLRNS